MIEFVKKYGYNGLYSQNGEYGILKECIKRMQLRVIIAVEFGAVDGFFCSNTADISLSHSVKRFLYDINPSGTGVAQKEITPDNVNEIPLCDILSIDIDGNDYAVWKEYKGNAQYHNGIPDIVIIEINSSLDPSVEFFHPDRGASYITMLRLGIEKGYFLLCHTGNMVFVLNKYKNLFPEIGDPYDYEKFFDKRWLLQPA